MPPSARADTGCHSQACRDRVARKAELHRTGCLTAACYRRITPCASGWRFTSTSYGPPWGGIQGRGVTAAGVDLSRSPRMYGIAADPHVLRLGARVRVWPNPFGYRGRFRVFDTGGAIKGARLDFYDWRGRRAQLAWGRRPVRVCT